MLHPARVGAIEVQQVHNAASRHRTNDGPHRDRKQVQEATVKSESTLFQRVAVPRLRLIPVVQGNDD